MQKLKSRLGALSFVALAIAIAGCGNSGSEAVKAQSKVETNADPVRFVEVVEQSIPDTLDLAAKAQADPTKVVHIFPPASGRVVAVEVKPGDHVRRGQTVAILNSSDVATARSDYAKAKIEADRATRAVERQELLFEHGAAAEKDFIDARAQADASRAELARAQQRLDLLNVKSSASSDSVPLIAPASGVVLDVSAAAGEFSKSLESANPLITVADLNMIWIVGDAYEKDVAKLNRGKPVSITLQAYPDRQWKGRIESISGALDPASRTLKVRVTLSNGDQRIKPEMFGTIHIQSGTHQGLVVPATAIIHEGSTTTAFVKSGGKTEQRAVTTGLTIGGNVEITSGLHPGDEVAAEGAELLKGGPTE